MPARGSITSPVRPLQGIGSSVGLWDGKPHARRLRLRKPGLPNGNRWAHGPRVRASGPGSSRRKKRATKNQHGPHERLAQESAPGIRTRAWKATPQKKARNGRGRNTFFVATLRGCVFFAGLFFFFQLQTPNRGTIQ